MPAVPAGSSRARATATRGPSPCRSADSPATATPSRPAREPREPAFWSYQSASYESRPDWVLPLEPGYARGNDLGMNDSDYGGGTPVVDVWRRDVGLAIGHVELLPKLVALPIERAKGGDVTLALRMKRELTLAPGRDHGDDPQLRRGPSR